MEIIIKFTDEELKLLDKALFHGAIHNIDENTSQRFEFLAQKIKVLIALSSEGKKLDTKN